MKTNFNDIKLLLAKNKVYDAWQYVVSLQNDLMYMHMSYELIRKVYDRRKCKIAEIEKSTIQKGFLCIDDLKLTDLEIGGMVIDDVIFLQKTVWEFFHYARISLDRVYQIINISLFGDTSFSCENENLIHDVISKLYTNTKFRKLAGILSAIKTDMLFKYLRAFDNYHKHIGYILPKVENSIIFTKKDEFKLGQFSYESDDYPSVDILIRIKATYKYVTLLIDRILQELVIQIPNCVDNNRRIQEVSFKAVYNKKEPSQNYLSFFIEVEELSDLPKEIKVLPLVVNDCGAIYYKNFDFDKIFIRKKGGDELSVIGSAELKNLNGKEFYRTYIVNSCSLIDYYNYISSFSTHYKKASINPAVMNGEFILLS